MKIEPREVEIFGFVSMVMGISLTLMGCFWDDIVTLKMFHQNIIVHKGYGAGQIIWMSFWALYSFWAWAVGIKWRNYQRQIHSLMEE
jgi:hypothetical protein